MNSLKALFLHSSDNVIFTDYEFNILWTNKQDGFQMLCGENCQSLFENEKLPLKSDTYYIKQGPLHYECKVINYPETENGIYILQIKNNDILYSFINCDIIKKIIINQYAAIRDSVTGISFSNDILGNFLKNEKQYNYFKNIDISHGNCCKILKTTMNATELIHYAEGNIFKSKIDFSSHLENFIDNIKRVLNDKIQITSDIQTELFFNSDPERLTFFLLSVLILANDRKAENNVVSISAKHIDNYISLTFTPGKCGVDYSDKTFATHIKMFDGDDYNTDLFVVNRFCKTFGCTLFVSENEDGTRSFSIKLPFDYSAGNSINFKSNTDEYFNDAFSIYRIMCSDMLYR